MTTETAVLAVLILLVLVRLHPGRSKRNHHSWLYRWYMKSPLWHFRRWLWFTCSNRRCEKCGCRMALHRTRRRPAVTVHHKTYARLGHERRSDMILCCWPCHQKMDSWRFR